MKPFGMFPKPSGQSTRLCLIGCWSTRVCPTLFALMIWIVSLRAKSPGCSDGSREGFGDFERIAACGGRWNGHVMHASILCARGWRVCGWYDRALLSNITWEQAISFPGCFVINAAHDGGKCQECRDDLEQDDLAGVGSDCSQQHRWQSSCITGGRVDSSCCVDSHFHRACVYQAELMTGALCCQMPTTPPFIILKPPRRMKILSGRIFLLPCKVVGVPPPVVTWYRNGMHVGVANRRTTLLSSGDLMVMLARRSDSGLYTCEAVNQEGFDSASCSVTVTELSSGCADKTSEGLSSVRDVTACEGRWYGHVRHGRSLCSKGWRVCSPNDRYALSAIGQTDVLKLDGCYAYNAAVHRGRCKKCRHGRMAGIGQACQWMPRSRRSCFSDSPVAVVPPANHTGCEYAPGVTAGVVCCRQSNHRHTGKWRPTCSPRCENDGVCISDNHCLCKNGYTGLLCQTPRSFMMQTICKRGCETKGKCRWVSQCRCKPGYIGYNCRRKAWRCFRPCFNGAQCYHSKCYCPRLHWALSCQHGNQPSHMPHMRDKKT